MLAVEANARRRTALRTECTQESFAFAAHFSRQVVAQFDGARMTTDGGGLLLRQVDRKLGLLRRVADLFPRRSRPGAGGTPTGATAGAARLWAGAGLRGPQRPRTAAPRSVVGGAGGREASWTPYAGRQEHAEPPGAAPAGDAHKHRYSKITYSAEAIDPLLVAVFVESYARAPRRIVLDLDATDMPLHGQQEDRFFHGYYDHYCYLPLYVFCGDHLLCARLRPSDIDASAGSLEEVQADRGADSAALAEDADRPAGRLWFLPRRVDGLVREPRRGLRVWVGAQRPAAGADRARHAAGAGRAAADGQGGAGVR